MDNTASPTSGAILAVMLGYFPAEAHSDTVDSVWQTATEKGTVSFHLY